MRYTFFTSLICSNTKIQQCENVTQRHDHKANRKRLGFNIPEEFLENTIGDS